MLEIEWKELGYKKTKKFGIMLMAAWKRMLGRTMTWSEWGKEQVKRTITAKIKDYCTCSGENHTCKEFGRKS